MPHASLSISGPSGRQCSKSVSAMTYPSHGPLPALRRRNVALACCRGRRASRSFWLACCMSVAHVLRGDCKHRGGASAGGRLLTVRNLNPVTDRHPVSNSRETDIQKRTDTYQATPTDRSHPVSLTTPDATGSSAPAPSSLPPPNGAPPAPSPASGAPDPPSAWSAPAALSVDTTYCTVR